MRVHDNAPAVSTHTDGELAALMLDQEGRIRDCNEPAEALFGFNHDELVARPVAFLLPQLRDVEWIQNGTLNPRLSFVCQIGRQFNAVRRDGSLFASMLFFHDIDHGKSRNVRLIIRRAERMA
jgi:PAS domain S-box-containing protein